MDKKLQNKLFEKYPKILFQREIIEFPIDQYGIEIRDGWCNLLDTLCGEVQRYVDFTNRTNEQKILQPEIIQVKSKFAIFTSYWKNTDGYIRGLIDMTKALSQNICEECGTNQEVKTNNKGYWQTLCKKCRKEQLDKNKENNKYIAEQFDLVF